MIRQLHRRPRPSRITFVLGALTAAGCGGDPPTSPPGTGSALTPPAVAAPAKPRPSAVKIRSLTVSTPTLVIEGAGTDYTVVLQNPGADASTIILGAEITQGNARRNAGGTVVFCPNVAGGTVPSGGCTMTTQAYATNVNAGTGTLVAGSAKLVVTLYQTVGTTTTVLDTRTTSVNLVAPSASIMSVALASTTLVIDDEVGTTYDVTLQNPTGASLPNVTLQGEIIQGDAFRGAGGFAVDCPPDHVIGVLPAGSCTIVFLTANAKNTAGGGGTLVPGEASFKLTLYQDVGDTQVIFDTEIVPITLTSSGT